MLNSLVRMVHVDQQSTLGAMTPLLMFRIAAGTVVVWLGCAIMFWLRAYFIGEDGSSLAIYFLGTFFIQVCSLLIFSTRPFNPEKTALTLCVVAVLVTGLWVNIEEKVVLPLVAQNCTNDCVIEYQRMLPFSDATLVYREDRGWRLLD